MIKLFGSALLENTDVAAEVEALVGVDSGSGMTGRAFSNVKLASFDK
jgi:hypothetical protein